MAADLHNDIGHGINTYPPNKGVSGLPEFEFNNAVGKEVKRLLKGQLETFEAQPFDGRDVPLLTRTNKYNAEWAKNRKAIGVSNHANASKEKSARGFGVYYWYTSEEGKRLAQLILNEYKAEFTDRDKYPIHGTGLHPSIKGTWSDFHMLRETDGIWVLCEWAFMTNAEDYKNLKSDDFRKRAAKVVARAAMKWHGKKLKEEQPAKPVVKQPTKIEVNELPEKVVVIGGWPDLAGAELIATRLKAPIYFRNALPSGKLAKEVYVVGGSIEGIQGDKVINLTGANRFEVMNKVEQFLK